jgi:DNA-binding NarL/FixJ family response regulator
MPVTVLIVDDHAGFRSSARRLLEAAGYAVVGDAPDGRACVEAAQRLHPAVVLLDIQLPGADGFEVAEQLAGLTEPPTIVLTSTRDGPSIRRRAAAGPARGFVRKDELSGATFAELLAA